MKTDVIQLESANLNMDRALGEVSKCAAYELLTQKQALRLQLLSEELLGMMKGILGDYKADFWLEAENKRFEIHLTANTNVSEGEREKLLSVSSSGENIAARGFMGRVRQVFEAALYGDDQALAMAGIAGSQGGYDMGSMAFAEAWSLMAYKAQMEAQAGREEWDELEKSIVASLADDVKVGVRCRQAEIIITKQF